MSTEFDKPLFVLNRKSGNGLSEKVFRQIVSAWPGAFGIDFKEFIEHPEIASLFDFIIVGAGDGSITSACHAVQKLKKRVLPLQFGSANCIPKSLGLGRLSMEPASIYVKRAYERLKSGQLKVREFRPGTIGDSEVEDYLCFTGIGIAAKGLEFMEDAREKKMRLYYARMAYAVLGLVRSYNFKHELYLSQGNNRPDVKILDVERLRTGFSVFGGIPVPPSFVENDIDLLITVRAPERGHEIEQFLNIVSDVIWLLRDREPLLGGIEISKIDPAKEVVIYGDIDKHHIHIDSEKPRNRYGKVVKLGQENNPDVPNYLVFTGNQ